MPNKIDPTWLNYLKRLYYVARYFVWPTYFGYRSIFTNSKGERWFSYQGMDLCIPVLSLIFRYKKTRKEYSGRVRIIGTHITEKSALKEAMNGHDISFLGIDEIYILPYEIYMKDIIGDRKITRMYVGNPHDPKPM